MVVALLIRAQRIGVTNLWLDEANSWLLTTYSASAMAANIRQSPGGPLYFFLLKGWSAIFGDSEVALRSLSLVASVPVVALTYAIGVQTLSRRAAFAAAALTTLSPLHLYFAQEARVYMVATLMSVCVVAAYLRWRTMAAAQLAGAGEGQTRPRQQALVLYAVAAILSFYTLGLTALLLIALAIDAVLCLTGGTASGQRAPDRSTRRRVATPWLVAQMAVALACLPLLVSLDASAAVQSQAWRGPMGAAGAIRNLLEFFLSAVHGLYFYPWDLYPAVTQHWPRDIIIRLFVVFPLTIIALVVAFSYPPADARRGPARALYLALLLPLVAGTVVSLRHELSLTRYMLFVTPFAFLLIAAGLARAPRWLAAPMSLALVGSATYGILQYPLVRTRDTDFRPVARDLAASAGPRDEVLVQPPEAGVQLAYYLRKSPLSVTLWGIPAGASLQGLLQHEAGTRTWLALDYRSLSYGMRPDSVAAMVPGHIASDHFAGAGEDRVRLIEIDDVGPTPLFLELTDTASVWRPSTSKGGRRGG
jgi:mannosyltransferase